MTTSNQQRGAAQQRCEDAWQNSGVITTTRGSSVRGTTPLGSAGNSGTQITSSAAQMRRDGSLADKSRTRTGFEGKRGIARGTSAWRVAHARGRSAGAMGCNSVAEATAARSRATSTYGVRVRMLRQKSGPGCESNPGTGCESSQTTARGESSEDRAGGHQGPDCRATPGWSRRATTVWSCGSNDGLATGNQERTNEGRSCTEVLSWNYVLSVRIRTRTPAP